MIDKEMNAAPRTDLGLFSCWSSSSAAIYLRCAREDAYIAFRYSAYLATGEGLAALQGMTPKTIREGFKMPVGTRRYGLYTGLGFLP